MKTNKQIPIFFSIDDSYAPYLAVALNSAIKNSSPDRNYKAIILHQNLKPEHQKRLSLLEKKNFEIEFYEMKQGLETITDCSSNYLRCDYFTLTIYFRLFIATMFPELEKAIYIDSDVVVLGDLAELYDINLGENLIGACQDKSVADVPPLVKYMEEYVGVKKEEYINSGVLLINLEEFRRAEIEKRITKYVSTYNFDTVAPDQDYLNFLCSGRICYLDKTWNKQPKQGGHIPVSDVRLIHYNMVNKPWHYSGVDYEDEFWAVADTTPFSEMLHREFEGYTDEKKEKDRMGAVMLVANAGRLADEKGGFMETLGALTR